MKWTEYLSTLRDRACKRVQAIAPDVDPADIAVKAYGEHNTAAGYPAAGQPFQISGYCTTDAVDLEQEVIIPDGVDWKTYFGKNKSMFVDHNYDALSCVGKWRSFQYTPRGIVCNSTLVEGGTNPLRDWVRTLAEGHQIGYSVTVQRIGKGAPTPDEAKKYPGAKLITRASKLIEISYTAIPMNGECQAFGTFAEAAKAVQSTKPRRTIVLLG